VIEGVGVGDSSGFGNWLFSMNIIDPFLTTFWIGRWVIGAILLKLYFDILYFI
jgi:hypothetical protein